MNIHRSRIRIRRTRRLLVAGLASFALFAASAPAVAAEVRTEDQRLTWNGTSLPVGSHFGASVGMAAAGDVAFVGAPQGRGRATFRFEAGAWDEVESNIGGGDDSTYVACSNSFALDTTVLAATRHIGGTYRVQPFPLSSVYVSGIDEGHVTAVANAGTTLAVGQADAFGGSGRVLVYEYDGAGWQLTDTLYGGSGDHLGAAVALRDAAVLIAGAPGYGNNGAIRIYVDIGDDWVLYQTIESNAGVTGQLGAEFGAAVAVAGPWIAVGSPSWDRPLFGGGYAADTGTVNLFELQGFGWELVAAVRPPEASAGDHYGASVALRGIGELGATLAVGSPFDDVVTMDDGAGYVWRLEGGAWQLRQRLVAAIGEPQAQLGAAIALGPRGVLVGAPEADANGLPNQGTALFFADLVLLFYDGFESGNTGGWSDVEP